MRASWVSRFVKAMAFWTVLTALLAGICLTVLFLVTVAPKP